MGIFGVNMPILYGEGDHAFLRLQYEIIKSSNDESIFAWEHFGDLRTRSEQTGMFAKSPASFKNSGDVVSCGESNRTYTMTNVGLQIHMQLIPMAGMSEYERSWLFWSNRIDTEFLAPLMCRWKSSQTPIAVKLRYDPSSREVFTRLSHENRIKWDDVFNNEIGIHGGRTIYIRGPAASQHQRAVNTVCLVQLQVSQEWYKFWHRYKIPSPAREELPRSFLWANSKWLDSPFEVSSRGGIVWIMFHKGGDRFYLGISYVSNRPSVQIYIPTRPGDYPKPSPDRPVDRVQKMLSSNKTVSAVLRKIGTTAEPNRPYFRLVIEFIDTDDIENDLP